MEEALVEIRNLSKTIGNSKIIENINIDVFRNDIHGFIGPNGSGKTTTLRCMLGLLRPDSGYCKIFNENSYYLGKDLKKRIGVVMDEGGIYEDLTAKDNLIFFGQVYGLSKEKILSYVKNNDHHFNLEKHLEKKVKDYSKGMKQKLKILKEMMHEPELVFLDEPFSGLDPGAKIELRSLLSSLKKRVTFFIISHDLHEVEKLCDKITIIKNGHIEACGNLSEITKAEKGVFKVNLKNFQSDIEKMRSLNEISVIDICNNIVKIKVNADNLNPAKFLFENGIEFIEIYLEKKELETFFVGGDINV